jgi:hypothetical protein
MNRWFLTAAAVFTLGIGLIVLVPNPSLVMTSVAWGDADA